MGDRLLGAAVLVCAALYGVVAWRLQVPFAYEPVGPRAFPMLIAALIALCAAVLLARPDANPRWPGPALAFKSALLVGVLVLYGALFASLGFMLSTAAATVAIGRLFGGTWPGCAAGGLVIGAGLYLLFDFLLGVSLPLGSLFFAHG